MIRGLTQDVEIQGCFSEQARETVSRGSAPDACSVIGVICAGDLAVHRDTIKQALKRGIEQRPDGGSKSLCPGEHGSPGTVWVCIEPKSDRLTHDLMISLDIEPVVLPMVECWRHRPPEGMIEGIQAIGYDFRRVWRDLEMLSLCDELIVFHRRSSSSPWRDRDASGLYAEKLVVVELGKEKPKAKKAA